jgi:hypothetical protein
LTGKLGSGRWPVERLLKSWNRDYKHRPKRDKLVNRKKCSTDRKKLGVRVDPRKELYIVETLEKRSF